MSPLFIEKMKESREKGGNMNKIGGRRNYRTEDNGAREINAAVGRAAIQQSGVIKFAVLNRSLVEVEK